jgi:hypothetical protein
MASDYHIRPGHFFITPVSLISWMNPVFREKWILSLLLPNQPGRMPVWKKHPG